MNISQEALVNIIIGILALFNIIVGYILSGIKQNMQDHRTNHEKLCEKIDKHREDVIKNYVTHQDMLSMKVDIIERIDRFEKTVVSIVGRRESDKDS